MRFNVGQKVRVKEVCSGGNFEEGDIVEITGIGFEDETDCYAATSPYDGETWYLDEDEVEPITNGDNIRSMSNEELQDLFYEIYRTGQDNVTTWNPENGGYRFKWDNIWLNSQMTE